MRLNDERRQEDELKLLECNNEHSNSAIELTMFNNGGMFTDQMLHQELINSSDDEDENTLQLHCHPPASAHSDNAPERALLLVTIITAISVIAEFVGGYFADSLAIITDAGHLLSDLLSFAIALLAARLAKRQATPHLSFGYYRAEIMAAIISILIIWALTAFLVYEAVLRCITPDFELHATPMIITAIAAVVINVVMAIILQWGGANIGHGHSHSIGHCKQSNINVRAAFIHVLGDLLQSVGVLVAAILVYIFPNLKLADPICTFLFSVFVLMTTVTVMRDALSILMEATPRHINYTNIRLDLLDLSGVDGVHSLHIWQLTAGKTAAITHIVTKSPSSEWLAIQRRANSLLRRKYGCHFANIQVEPVDEFTEKCLRCQPLDCIADHRQINHDENVNA